MPKKKKKKVKKVMKEFSEGKLKSSSGKKVTNPKQALAIGYSEQRQVDKNKKKPAKKKAKKIKRKTKKKK